MSILGFVVEGEAKSVQDRNSKFGNGIHIVIFIAGERPSGEVWKTMNEAVSFVFAFQQGVIK